MDEHQPPFPREQLELPPRRGSAPEVMGPAPHGQRSQVAPIMVQEELWGRMRALAYTYMAPTQVSVSHARALFLLDGVGAGPADRFQAGREFAHLHPHHDGSLHLTLPGWAKDEVVAAGWGVRHPVQNAILIYGPRDRQELEVVWTLVRACYQWSLGVAAEALADRL